MEWTEWIADKIEPPIGKRCAVIGMGGVCEAVFMEDEKFRRWVRMLNRPSWFIVLPPHPKPTMIMPEYIG